MKTEIDKNIKIDKNIQAENIHKGVDEITINDFVAKNDKDVRIKKARSFKRKCCSFVTF